MVLLQIAMDTASKAAATIASQTPQGSLSLLELIEKGGWILLPIGILSVIAIYLIIERWLTINKASKVDPNFMNNIRSLLLDGKTD
ncbi:MAG: MotA/TolQ/ExbB proton channel family protein, partial [Bacteroidetes bacterium]|nr:MotA/TolQ/ExbB proton channel family protein [Bacteroidota bacterium]